MTNPKEGGMTTASPAQEKSTASNPAPSENQLRYLWDTLFKLRKGQQFYKRKSEWLEAILQIVYEPNELRLALARYEEWLSSQKRLDKEAD